MLFGQEGLHCLLQRESSVIRTYRNAHRLPRLRDLVSCCRDNVVWGEAELLLQFLEGGGRPECLHANTATAAADISVPAEGRPLFHRDARGDRLRQHQLTVIRVIATVVLEHLPRWHAHHTSSDPLPLEHLVGFYAKRNFAPGRQEQHLSAAVSSIRQNIGATPQAVG